MADKPFQLIVGLGNPGPEYERTRHNAGFWFVDELARRHGGQFSNERRYNGDVCRIQIGPHDVRLLKPQTFMNRSGLAVQSLAAYLKVPPEQILVAHDDLDLPVGSVRLKWNGGHGGHNGLRDIISHLGADFRRVRIGIGHPQKKAGDVIDYVLKRPGKDEERQIEEAIQAAADVLPSIYDTGFEKGMQQLHSRDTVPRPYRKGSDGG